MKKKVSILAVALLALGLTACGNSNTQAANSTFQTVQAESSQKTEASQSSAAAASSSSQATSKSSEATQNQAEASSSSAALDAVKDTSSENAAATTKENDTLVVYFSATGTTRGVAEKIANITGADTYEIKAAQEYSDADLNWHDQNSRSTKEQNDSSARPQIGSGAVSIDKYTTIYIGYPIWWGEEPRIMDTFVESYNFDGKTMIPFCTSSSSGMGRSGQNLEKNAKSGTWLQGQRFGAGASEDNIRSWIEGLK